MEQGTQDLYLVYDKQCPFCEAYCRLARVRKAAGKLHLIDARDGGPLVHQITARGLDIDEGMVLIAGEQLYYGSDAIHALALLSSRSGVFNRINFLVFRSRVWSGMLYPVLRASRNLVLRILRRTRINNLELPSNDRY